MYIIDCNLNHVQLGRENMLMYLSLFLLKLPVEELQQNYEKEQEKLNEMMPEESQSVDGKYCLHQVLHRDSSSGVV